MLKGKYFLIGLLLFFCGKLTAQSVTESLSKTDTPKVVKSVPVKKKTTPAKIRADSSIQKNNQVHVSVQNSDVANLKKSKPSYAEIINQNPYFSFSGKPTLLSVQLRGSAGKEAIFYLLCGLILFFAFVKVFFNKYLQNLLSVFFRISLKQKQMREQLLQAPLPSLLLNGFFVITASIYITFLFKIYRFNVTENFWWLLLYCIVIVFLIYLVKFLGLKFVGWVFNIKEASNTYIFIIFLINKLLGIFLMPLLVLMAFSDNSMVPVWVTLSYVVIALAFTYRYVSAFGPIRREINVNPLHFFIYLCAFEIIPVILIYKMLLKFFERSF